MKVLVGYATRHGATRGIAERIAQTLERHGLEVGLEAVDARTTVDAYDAFVIGGAAYFGRWLGPARQFADAHRNALSRRPVWLFSSGPIGTERVDAKGRDVIAASQPRDFAELAPRIHPRDQRVFFGAYDPGARPVGLLERLGAPFLRMESVREAMPAGDFRDWPAIEAWADGIRLELEHLAAPATG